MTTLINEQEYSTSASRIILQINSMVRYDHMKRPQQIIRFAAGQLATPETHALGSACASVHKRALRTNSSAVRACLAKARKELRLFWRLPWLFACVDGEG